LCWREIVVGRDVVNAARYAVPGAALKQGEW